MHRTTRIAAGTLAVFALAACADGTTAPANLDGLKPNFGNGFPNNGRGITLYKMNLIGHPGTPTSDMLNDQGKRIFVKLVFDAGRFDGATVEGMLSRLSTLLEELAADPHGMVSSL